MKLYATVTSERATKGQGGKWLDIVIRNEDNKPVIAIKARTGGARRVHAFISTDMRYANASIESVGFIEDEKGKKQKDALCGKCYTRTANSGDTLCETCAKQNAL